MQIILPLMR